MWNGIFTRTDAMESQTYFLGGVGAIAMGLTLGIFGAGGSILTVPLLVYLLGYAPSLATHYSLFVVGIVSAFGVSREWQSGSLPFRPIVWFAFPAMVGMFVTRKILLPALPQTIEFPGSYFVSLDSVTMATFAVFMMAASLSLLFLKIEENESAASNSFALLVAGLFIGLATGFVGAGGGFLIVPALVFFGNFSLKNAARASLVVIMANSLWGFFSSALGVEIPWSSLLLVSGLAAGGMFFGIKVRARLPAEKLKPLFGVFVFFMGSYVLWRSF